MLHEFILTSASPYHMIYPCIMSKWMLPYETPRKLSRRNSLYNTRRTKKTYEIRYVFLGFRGFYFTYLIVCTFNRRRLFRTALKAVFDGILYEYDKLTNYLYIIYLIKS